MLCKAIKEDVGSRFCSVTTIGHLPVAEALWESLGDLDQVFPCGVLVHVVFVHGPEQRAAAVAVPWPLEVHLELEETFFCVGISQKDDPFFLRPSYLSPI